MSFRNEIVVAIGLIASVLSVPPASAEEQDSDPWHLYLGYNVGYDHYIDDDRNEFGHGRSTDLQFGIRIDEHVRVELELGRSDAELDNTNDDELSYGRITLAAYYDLLPTDELFAPYIGGGVGAATVQLNGDRRDEGTLWSLHGEAGLSINIIEHLFTIVPSYRYTWIEDDTSLLGNDLTSHAFRIGARLRLDWYKVYQAFE